jgi:hypothetical protein
MVIQDIGELAGKLDIPIHVVTARAFHSFRMRLMQSGGQANAIAHDRHISVALPAASHATIAQEMLTCTTEVFAQRLDVVDGDHRFVNVVCDAGTVANKVVHHPLANPTRFPETFGLEPYENENWTPEQYNAFFAETIAWLSEHAPRTDIPVYGVICDHVPAQVVALLQFLRNTAGVNSAIMHIPCLNHMVNRVGRVSTHTLVP